MVRPTEGRPMGTEEAMATAIVQMLETNEMKKKTLSDLDDEEIGVLALLETMGKKMKIPVVNDFIRNFCQFRVSRFRLGRREMGAIVSTAGMSMDDRFKKKKLGDLYSGLRS